MPDDAIRWPVWKRLGFRFLAGYFILYSLPFPLDYLPFAGPKIERLWNSIWVALVPRLAKHFLSRPLVLGTAGSSDSTFSMLQIACFAILAAIVALLWTWLDRNRPEPVRVYRFLYDYLRFTLAAAMLSYGIQKVIPLQFPPLSLDRLVQTYGTSSPMGFMWTFMGASAGYEMFAGAAELLAGLLLLPRRTALLGALVTIGVMSNVVAINVFFDVSVKTYSSHLLLIAVFLAAPEARNIAAFFFRRPAQPSHVSFAVVGVLLAALFIYTDVSEMVPFYRQTYRNGGGSPLRGIWNVDLLDVDGVARPPLVTDAARWRRIVFDEPGRSSIFLMNDERNRYRTKIDERKTSIAFVNRYDAADAFRLAYVRPDPTTLQLDGTVAGHKIHAVCKLDQQQFLLTSRGFHWINERAVNR